jgi:membrane-associated phospholipid phosphatase
MKSLKESLNISDIYALTFFILMLIQNVIFFGELNTPLQLLFQNLAILTAIPLVAYLEANYNKFKIINILRNFYHVAFILISYNTVQEFIEIVHPQIYDPLIAKIDTALFGFNIADVFMKISHPILTEYMQICYFSYYFGAIALGLEFIFKDNGKYFDQYLRHIVFSFSFLFLLYYILPTIGPRFYLYDYSTFNQDLPGLWFTEPIRDIINAGCRVPVPYTPDFTQINPDCVPSGHTWIELIILVMAFKTKAKSRWVLLFFGTGLLISTMYLRYHYLIDIVLGVIFFLIAWYLEPRLGRWINSLLKR